MLWRFRAVCCSGFPSEAVVDAYMNPTVDESREDFSWGRPDLDLLRQYPSLVLSLQNSTIANLSLLFAMRFPQ